MSESSRVDAAVIIVGVNARRFVAQCVESVRDADWAGYSHHVIYCDNGSTDGTLELLASDYPWVETIANGKNLGYCIAANIGAHNVMNLLGRSLEKLGRLEDALRVYERSIGERAGQAGIHFRVGRILLHRAQEA